MNASGLCKVRKGAIPEESSVLQKVTHRIGSATLSMWAEPLTRMDDIDSPRMLTVPLPHPFGRSLVLEPVVWTCAHDDGSAFELTVKKLDALLDKLHSSFSMPPPSMPPPSSTMSSVRTASATVDTAATLKVGDVYLPSDDEQSSEYDSEYDGISAEEEGEEEEEEGRVEIGEIGEEDYAFCDPADDDA